MVKYYGTKLFYILYTSDSQRTLKFTVNSYCAIYYFSCVLHLQSYFLHLMGTYKFSIQVFLSNRLLNTYENLKNVWFVASVCDI